MVFGLFSKEKALQRTIEKATKKLAQHVDRMAAMEKLSQDGSEEALLALLKRFSFTYDKGVEDENEKRWVVDVLSAKGDVVLEPVRKYLKSATAIAYPLEILGKAGSHDQVLTIIDEAIESEEPGYSRDPGKKKQLIDWLAEWPSATDEEVAERVAPYLADFDEGVRFAAVEALGRHPAERAAPALTAALINPDEESGRLKRRIAEVLAAGDMSLGDRKTEIAEILKSEIDGFTMKYDRIRKQ